MHQKLCRTALWPMGRQSNDANSQQYMFQCGAHYRWPLEIPAAPEILVRRSTTATDYSQISLCWCSGQMAALIY